MQQQKESWEQLAAEALSHGQSCFQRGDHAGAILAYSAALDALVGEQSGAGRGALAARLYCQRGHSRFIGRQLDDAIADYDRALEHDPAMAEAYAYRGLIAYQTGKSIGAVADFNAAITLYQRQGEPAALGEAYFNRGNAQYQRRDYLDAEADYSAALALQPDMVDGLIYRGVARYQLGDSAGSAADYAQAIAHPATTPAQRAAIHYNRGLLLRQQGDLAGAIEAYSAALEIQPNDADSLMNRGNARAEGGDLPAAIDDYRAALRLNPWLEDGFNICGMARMSAGDLHGAIEDFNRAIARDPRVGNLHFNRGCARLQLGDLPGAIEDFSVELERHAPGLKGRIETREQRAELYNNRGLAYHYQGDLTAAIDDYTRSLRQLRLAGSVEAMSERLASTLLNRGVAYRDRAFAGSAPEMEQETLRAAADDLRQVLELAPDPALAKAARQSLADVERMLPVQGAAA
jgi:tetratricopeptide (TPR) repeat protein